MKLYHLFPDLMNLYGDYGNLVALKKALEEAGETAEIVPVHPGDRLDFADADFLYMGPGTEPARNHALTLLQPHLDVLRAALTKPVPALFTGNAWSLLGQTITLASGETLDGLGLFGYATAETRDRYTGDAIALPSAETLPIQDEIPQNQDETSANQGDALSSQEIPLPNQTVVGFLNRCDRVDGVTTPLFSLQMGKGNDGASPAEGFCRNKFFATHLIGPILVKNPHLLHFFVSLLGVTPAPLDETSHPALAYRVTLQALQARLAK